MPFSLNRNSTCAPVHAVQYMTNLQSILIFSVLDWKSVYPVGTEFFHLQPDVQNKDVIQLPLSSGAGLSALNLLNSLVLWKCLQTKREHFTGR